MANDQPTSVRIQIEQGEETEGFASKIKEDLQERYGFQIEEKIAETFPEPGQEFMTYTVLFISSGGDEVVKMAGEQMAQHVYSYIRRFSEEEGVGNTDVDVTINGDHNTVFIEADGEEDK